MTKGILLIVVSTFIILAIIYLPRIRIESQIPAVSPDINNGEPVTVETKQIASFWKQMDDNRVLCQLCPHNCLIPSGAIGFCRVRENIDGTLFTLVYGKPTALGESPIEKAPFHHFHPGHFRRTIATVGCNMRCLNCQNWHISQRSVDEMRYLEVSPQEMIDSVLRAGLASVSFTYTEPTVFFEYMLDIAKLAKQNGLKTNLVTNGFINPEPLRVLLAHMDAIRVDLKSFNAEFYRNINNASLAPVLETIKTIKNEGVHLEIINLIIPTLNDNPDEIRKMCEWIYNNLGPDVPLHFNRFFPSFKLTDLTPTPLETLEMAHRIASEVGLRFVYIGNYPGHRYGNTFCPNCDEMLIQRIGISVIDENMDAGYCKFCRESIPGVWD